MIDTLWLLLCTGLVFLMQAGFMCLESGMTRSKNSINVAVKNLADFGLSVAYFWLFGYALMFGASWQGWVGLSDFVPNVEPADVAVLFLFQAMFCGTATTIISGALAERLKFTAYLAIATWVAALVYPLFGHWAWNDHGWLKQLGFIDFAGSTVVHSVGAWVSAAVLLTVGARHGRFEAEKSIKIQGSNLPFSVLGALLLWFGWIGFNGGSELVLNDAVPGIILNTMMAGVSGMIVGGLLSWLQHRYVEVDGLVNGSIAGLVAVTASCQMVTTPIAVIIGGTGAAVMIVVSWWIARLQIDDAVDAIAVHGGAGAWGTLAVGLFGNSDALEASSRLAQIGVQGLGVGCSFLWAFGVTWVLFKLINSVWPLRVSAEAEALGLNITEHQAKTETYDLFQVMDYQARTFDLSQRVPVEPFTEAGHIATRYNQVIDALEHNHQQSATTLEQIYMIASTVAAAVESQTFAPDPEELELVAAREDELGMLAGLLLELTQAVRLRNQTLEQVQSCLRAVLFQLIDHRFGGVPANLRAAIAATTDTSTLTHWLQQVIILNHLSELETLIVHPTD
jgi:Amt family ammonium transporter